MVHKLSLLKAKQSTTGSSQEKQSPQLLTLLWKGLNVLVLLGLYLRPSSCAAKLLRHNDNKPCPTKSSLLMLLSC